MNPFLPPTRDYVKRNMRLLAEDWAGGTFARRYFIASQLASGLLLGTCSLASIAAGIAGWPEGNLGLLGVAALCFVQTIATWNVLKRRFQVRYEVW
jgi:hypothetical protein